MSNARGAWIALASRTTVVRALMLYGANNPVDGAVLQVILRKAEKIRKELGVSVPMPADNNKVMETIMQTVLLRTGGIADAQSQLRFDFGAVERELETAWDSAHAKARESRTIFAQRRLRPDDVLPEWHKAVAVLGGEDEVRRFVRVAAERLHAPLEPLRTIKGECYRLPVDHLPLPVRERLAAIGIDKPLKLTFSPPAPAGVEHVHRAHPLIVALAEYVAERTLEEEVPDLAARSGAIFTDAVTARTTVYLLRLRSQLAMETLEGNRVSNGGTYWRKNVSPSVWLAGTWICSRNPRRPDWWRPSRRAIWSLNSGSGRSSARSPNCRGWSRR